MTRLCYFVAYFCSYARINAVVYRIRCNIDVWKYFCSLSTIHVISGLDGVNKSPTLCSRSTCISPTVNFIVAFPPNTANNVYVPDSPDEIYPFISHLPALPRTLLRLPTAYGKAVAIVLLSTRCNSWHYRLSQGTFKIVSQLSESATSTPVPPSHTSIVLGPPSSVSLPSPPLTRSAPR